MTKWGILLKCVSQRVKVNKQTTRVKPRTLKSTNVHLVADEGQNLGITDRETANKLFEVNAWTDSIDIFSYVR